MFRLWIVFFFFFTRAAGANPIDFSVLEKSTANFSVPYTLGVHKGTSDKIAGAVKYDPQQGTLTQVSIRVPITSLRTGDPKRDCHMFESLGLDYSISDFPKKHVCNSDHQLAGQGPNSIKFEFISFSSSSPVALKDGKHFVEGEWSLHGVSKKDRVEVEMLKISDSTWKVTGSYPLSLKDFGVVVKPFLFISTKDRVDTQFEILMSK